MVGAPVISSFFMSDVYPASAAHAKRSLRLSCRSPAARSPSYRRKKSTSTSKQVEQDNHLVVKTDTATTTTTGNTNRAPDAQAQQSLAGTCCNALEEAINTFIDPPALRRSVDPRHVLAGNFAPVEELPPTPCPVVRGSIPRCLAGGAYIRNGPNPQHLPRGPHHLFDGDGMLHSLLLPASPSSDPVLCSRYVQTHKYLLERGAGQPVLPSIIGGFHGVAGVARAAVAAVRVLTGQMSLAEGVGVANASLAFFGGCLYALCESDLPYAVRVDPDTGEVTTHGRCDFGGRLTMGMTAHPKKDPITGELFAFRYSFIRPFVTYFWFDPAGNKAPDVPIFSVERPYILHDFAVTEQYAIFLETQLVMKPMAMVTENGALVGADSGKVPRLGVLPRYAADESEMLWFELPGFNMVHSVNAWEEAGGEELVLVASNMTKSIEHLLGSMELVNACIEMVRINLRTGTVSRTPLSAEKLEFGVVHPGCLGRQNRYGYFSVGVWTKISGVAKLDFGHAGEADCTVARRDFGPGCFVGEPFFVPDQVDGNGNEDDGYVVCYVHNEATGDSSFVVMDARSSDLDIVAEVQLPTRVPYGFHGLFVTQAELRSQHR